MDAQYITFLSLLCSQVWPFDYILHNVMSVGFICVISGQCLTEVGMTPPCSYPPFLGSRTLMNLHPSCDQADDNSA